MEVRATACALIAVAVLCCGCAGKQPREPLAYQSGILLDTDGLIDGHYYYDTWIYQPSQSGEATFRMDSDVVDSRILLEDSQGHILRSATADGYDSDTGEFDGEATLTYWVVPDESYTLLASSQNDHETGPYVVEWSEWMRLIQAGD